jgi:glycosyltransferase involved in cell wall biosynthesis
MDSPEISAIICTRDRGASAALAARTVLANSHPCFELIVLDQSTNDLTEEALREFEGDPRLRYVRSATRGLGRSRNIALRLARAPLVAFTDDDCRVPANWLEVIATSFARHPRVAVLFSDVDAGEHDPTRGFIPAYKCGGTRLVRTFWDKCHARAIGASMAVRREPILGMGGFDDLLGAGGRFPSCEDADIAVRAIALGHWVLVTEDVSVLHDGFRTWKEGRALARRDWVGTGAAYVKPLKAGHWSALSVVLYELLVPCIFDPLRPLLRLRRPQGPGRLIGFVRGFLGGLGCPVQRDEIRYRVAAVD